MDMSFDRPSRALLWTAAIFGDGARDPHERAMRFLEEAFELAYAIGIDRSVAEAIAARVYSRAPGDVSQGVGQALLMLELLAKVVDVDADREATAEFVRIQSMLKEEWVKRRAAKVATGSAR